jgi:hypothetical protein
MAVGLRGVGRQQGIVEGQGMLTAALGEQRLDGGGLRGRRKAVLELQQARHLTDLQAAQHMGPERLLAVGAGRQGKDADDALARRPGLQPRIDLGPDVPIGGIGQQIVTQLGVAKRLGLAHQLADEVAVVDTTGASLVAHGIDPRQAQCPLRPDIAFDAVIEDMQPQPLADQARRDRVEHPLDLDGAGGGDADHLLGEVGGTVPRQLLEGGSLGRQGLGAAAVEPLDLLVEPGAIGLEGVERAAATQQQRRPGVLVIFDALLRNGN